ncbi:MAG TPA: hypothetical protein PLB62_11060, partial [Candidatus Sumerlaeota bacterium]|nr:hypothetical protein [Candidatus Sumerlaeota bacterium]
AQHILDRFGFPSVCLSDDLTAEGDAAAVAEIARWNSAGHIIIDHYGLGETFRRRMKESGLCTLVLDDIAVSDAITADIILNQNPGAEHLLEQYRAIASCARHYLLGADYVMLREDVLEKGAAARKIRHNRLSEIQAGRRPNILVTFGGSDVAGLTPLTMQILLDSPFLFRKAFIIRGPGMTNPENLRLMHALAGKSERLVILDNPPISDIMASADLAVTAGGSTTHELAWFGIAMIIVQVAENQRLVCREYEERKRAIVLDNARSLEGELRMHVKDLLAGPDMISRFSTSAMESIDGRGVERITDILSSCD